LLRDDEEFRFRRLPLIEVKGVSSSLVTYEPFFTSQVSNEFLNTFDKGLVAMEEGKMEAAMAYFSKSDQIRPGGDPASKIWLKACKTALVEGHDVGVKMMKK